MAALLSLSGITLKFAGNIVLQDVSFTVGQRAIASLIGPNGAGKTSLFNAITGFYKPQAGTIAFDGKEMFKLKPHQVTQAGIARTFQNVRLFRDMTVMENVMSGMHCRTGAGALSAILRTPSQRQQEDQIRAVSQQCLEFVGVWSERNRIATTLAYGHQRRVEIARALATKPKLLLLDEPAAGLNPTEKIELLALIGRIRDDLGLSVLLIEHDMGLVMRISEAISVLDHGVIIAEGTPKQIQSDPKVIEAYLGRDDGEAFLDD